jgi:hypothetical protein
VAFERLKTVQQENRPRQRRDGLSASRSEAASCIQNRPSLPFQKFHDFLGIFRLDSHFFQGGAKVLEEQVEGRIVQTVTSGLGMGDVNIFAGVHSSAEQHGNEHQLPGAEVRHVSLSKEVAEVTILQNLLAEDFRSGVDHLMSANQFI